jgi:hypothetical protein
MSRIGSAQIEEPTESIDQTQPNEAQKSDRVNGVGTVQVGGVEVPSPGTPPPNWVTKPSSPQDRTSVWASALAISSSCVRLVPDPEDRVLCSNSDSSGFVRVSFAIAWLRSPEKTGLPQTFQ